MGFRKKCVSEEYKFFISFHSVHKTWMTPGTKTLILAELQELSVIPYLFLNPQIKTAMLKAHIEVGSAISFFKSLLNCSRTRIQRSGHQITSVSLMNLHKENILMNL